jgi:hypothetical protein
MQTNKKVLPEGNTRVLASDQNQAEPNPKDTNSNSRPFVRDAAVAATGAAIGITGSSFAHALSTDDSENAVSATVNDATHQSSETTANSPSVNSGNEDVKPEASPVSEQVVHTSANGAHVAHVDNSLTFGEAFAEARNQVGPGGIFSYHGQMYNTYYREEWSNMTSEQKNEYYASVSEHNTPHSDYLPHDSIPEPIHETFYNTDHPEAQSSGDEVYVLGVGSAIIEGHEVYVAQLSMGGEDVVLLDIDKDGTYDYLIADDNSDGKITPDEVCDISQHHITLDQLQEDLHPKPDVFAQDPNMPDYTNDADISHFS